MGRESEGLSCWLSSKETACQCGRHRRCVFDPRVGKIPWRRKWQPTPVFLPGKSHGQRSLALQELDTAKQLNNSNRESEQAFFQRRHIDGKWVYENVLDITNHQGNANQNHNETSPHTCQNDY